MTIRAIAGLAGFNLFLAVLGSAVLFALRPTISRRDLLRLCGLSYLLGVAALMVVLVLWIVLDVPVTFLSIALTSVALLVAASALGRHRRRAVSSVDVGGGSVRFMSVTSALVLAAVVLSLEAIFRKGRLQGLIEFDGWDSWGPKAGALYHFGHLSPAFLDRFPGGSYPPGLPAVLASALHAIGSGDVVTLHLQYWFFGVGFVAALVGLLADRVTPFLLLPFALLVFVMPDIRSRSVDVYGDLPLGFLVATAVLLVALWLESRRPWLLPPAALVLAGAALTKREGLLLAGCVVLAGLVASLDRIKLDWQRLAAVFLAALAAWIPWQIWLLAHGLPGNGPAGGLDAFTDVGRGWDALVVVTRNLFEFDLRLVSATVAVAAVGLCLLAKAWRIAAYLASIFVLFVAACTTILWSDPNVQLTDANVVSRLVGTATLVFVAVSPLALQRAWEAGGQPASETPSRREPAWRLGLTWALVLGAAIAYPATLLAEGGARFPKASDCVTPASRGGELRVVFGYAASYSDALTLRDRAGAGSVQVGPDGCGRVRVFQDVTSGAEGQEVIRRARAGRLTPHLEARASR